MLGFAEDGEELLDGGKRAAFFRGKPSDLLYWWYIYESNDLLEMTFAEFGASVDDSSDPGKEKSLGAVEERGRQEGGEWERQRYRKWHPSVDPREE